MMKICGEKLRKHISFNLPCFLFSFVSTNHHKLYQKDDILELFAIFWKETILLQQSTANILDINILEMQNCQKALG